MPEKRLYDYLQSFPLGINSDVDPLLLPKTQLAFAVNATFRGDFIRQRPAYQKMGFRGDIPGAFGIGVFQDACRFSPKRGSDFIILAVGGNLFQAVVNPDNTITIIQVVLPDGLNSVAAVQPNWMWQAERWLVWNDGTHLPIFYDGTPVPSGSMGARRSKGTSGQPLATIISSFIVPPVGQTVNAQTSVQYVFNGQTQTTLPVLLSGANESATYTLESAFTSQTAAGRIPVSFALVTNGGLGGDIIKPGASFILPSKYLGQILSAADASSNPWTTWMPVPIGPTGATNDGTLTDTNLGGSTVGAILSATVGGVVYNYGTGGGWPAMTQTNAAQNDKTIVDTTAGGTIMGGIGSVKIGGVSQNFWPAATTPLIPATNENTVYIGGSPVSEITSAPSALPPIPIVFVASTQVTINTGATKPMSLAHFGCFAGSMRWYSGTVSLMVGGDGITVAGTPVAVDSITVDGGDNVTSFTCHATSAPFGTPVAVGSTFVPISHTTKMLGSSSSNNGTIICTSLQYYLNVASGVNTYAVASYTGGPFNSGTNGQLSGSSTLNTFTIALKRAVTVANGATIYIKTSGGLQACKVYSGGGANVASLVLQTVNASSVGQAIPLYVGPTGGAVVSFVMALGIGSFTGAVGDALTVGGVTMKVLSPLSTTAPTCQIVETSYGQFTSVAVPLYVPSGTGAKIIFPITLAVAAPTVKVGDSLTAKAAADSGSGAFLLVEAGIAGGGKTFNVSLQNNVQGQSIPFWAAGTSGTPNVLTLTMNKSVSVHKGDTLIANLTSPGVGSVSLTVFADSVGATVTVQTVAGAGLPIVFQALPMTLAQQVVDTNNTSVQTIGTYPNDNGILPTPVIYLPISITTLTSSVLFIFSGTSSASIGQIIEVTNSNSVPSTDILFVQSVSPPTVAGASYYVQLKNQTDTPGATVSPGTVLLAIPELPISTIGAYGMGRNWVSMPDGKSFVAGDLIGSSSGSIDYLYNDAVLKVSQNQWLASAGTFVLPSAGNVITGMKFISSLDASLGQGPLQVFTDGTVFSCNTTTDMTEWAKLTSPILTESLVGSGAAGPFSIIQENNDIMFRSTDGGYRSMLIARLDYNKWGNTPISREVSRSLEDDDPALFQFSSSVVFNNRLLAASGGKTGNRGVYQTKLVALNFDALSSLQNKQPSIWEGEWNGLNMLKVVAGMFNGVERCFAVCVSSDQTSIEFHEITIDGSQGPDDGTTPIAWGFESNTLFKDKNPESREYKRLINGEFYIDQIEDDVQVSAFYKPDQHPQWIPWYSTIVAKAQNENGFRPRIGLGEPPSKIYDTVNNRPLREAYNFQVKFTFVGQCRFVGARFCADIIPQPEFAKPI